MRVPIYSLYIDGPTYARVTVNVKCQTIDVGLSILTRSLRRDLNKLKSFLPHLAVTKKEYNTILSNNVKTQKYLNNSLIANNNHTNSNSQKIIIKPNMFSEFEKANFCSKKNCKAYVRPK